MQPGLAAYSRSKPTSSCFRLGEEEVPPEQGGGASVRSRFVRKKKEQATRCYELLAFDV